MPSSRDWITMLACIGVMGCAQAKPETLGLDDLYTALSDNGLKVENRKSQIALGIKAEVGESFVINGTRCEVFVWDLNSKDGAWGFDNTKQYGLYGGETVMRKNMGVTCKGDTTEAKKVFSIAQSL